MATIRKLFPSGAYEALDIVDGHLETIVFFGYTEEEVMSFYEEDETEQEEQHGQS
jgi:hypothetical protein